MATGYIVIDHDDRTPVTARLEGEPPVATRGSNRMAYEDAIAEDFPDDV